MELVQPENSVHQVSRLRVNRVPLQFHEPLERAIEGSVAVAAAGDEDRGAGGGRSQRQGGLVRSWSKVCAT
jgi:hypothetical protein